MKRRTVLELLGAYAGAIAFLPRSLEIPELLKVDREGEREIESAFRPLRGEEKCRAQIRVERGGPRLFVNGRETVSYTHLTLPTIYSV